VYNNNKKGITMQESGLKVSLLASGSSGNATYIETPKQKILVDCGLTGKAITAQMEKIDRSISDVDAILVTHEHGLGFWLVSMEFQFMPMKKRGKLWLVKSGKWLSNNRKSSIPETRSRLET